MNTTGIVFHPPIEANSLLLQVPTGCSHNSCTFCYMYRGVPFTMCPLEQVKADLDEAALYGDPFTMPAERLLKIAELIHRKLPKAETIAMYAPIQNIRRKTDAALWRLRDAGINGLDIGVELWRENIGNNSSDAPSSKQQKNNCPPVRRIVRRSGGFSFYSAPESRTSSIPIRRAFSRSSGNMPPGAAREKRQ